jgi:D-galactonate transporter
MRFLARSSFDDPREDRMYNRIAMRLLPFLLVAYVVSFLDKVNVGFAKLQMATDIGLTDQAFGFAAGIFFIGYCICEIPSNLMLQKVGAKFWIARIMVVWGALSVGMMFVRTDTAFFVMRFLLGVAEAGFYPGIVLYLTYWFPTRLRSQVNAIFFLGIALSGVIGGPLSGLIMSSLSGAAGLAGWQWLFLIEGAPAVALGVVTYFYLSNGPRDAKWLSAQDRAVVAKQLESEHASQLAAGTGHSFGAAFRDPNIWLLAFANFALLGSTYGVSFWLPQIVRNLGVKSYLDTGLIASIPFVAAAIGMVLIGRHSDRHDERRWHAAGSALMSAFGLVVAGAFSASPVISLAGLSIAMTGALAGLAVMWSLPGVLLTGTAAAAGIALMATVGNLGGYVTPFVIGWLKQHTQRLEYGLYALAAVTLAGAFAMLCLPKLRCAVTSAARPQAGVDIIDAAPNGHGA